MLLLHRIQTQDVLFGGKNVKRAVEIGASNILAVMAQRTLKSKFEAHDAVCSIQRLILTWTKDAKDIRYEFEPVEEPAQAQEAFQNQATSPIAASASSSDHEKHTELAQRQSPRPENATVTTDIALVPIDVLRAIIAHKLGKPLTDVRAQLSIKDLAGGKFDQDHMTKMELSG